MYVNEFPIPKLDDLGRKTSLEILVNIMAGNHQNPALEQLLNALVYELYFESDLHTRGLHIFAAAEAAGLASLSGLEGEALTAAAATFTQQNLAPGQPLRVMLSDLQTLDVVRIIEGRE
jgi:adenine-specific DNA-methyltransferase